jgi:catechol 2,3-dioxygenase-like lactoylglutathione lyase family enzyme
MKLAHARIVTNDVPGLTRFYRDLTGMTPTGDDVYVEFHGSALTLAISSQRMIERHSAGATVPAANRSVILDFEVADVDQERARLAGIVSDFVLEPTTQP